MALAAIICQCEGFDDRAKFAKLKKRGLKNFSNYQMEHLVMTLLGEFLLRLNLKSLTNVSSTLSMTSFLNEEVSSSLLMGKP